MIVLGIDPGTAVTGYGLVSSDGRLRDGSRAGKNGHDAPRLIECGVIRTLARSALCTRLNDIFDGVSELIARHHPDARAVAGGLCRPSVRRGNGEPLMTGPVPRALQTPTRDS